MAGAEEGRGGKEGEREGGRKDDAERDRVETGRTYVRTQSDWHQYV